MFGVTILLMAHKWSGNVWYVCGLPWSLSQATTILFHNLNFQVFLSVLEIHVNMSTYVSQV